MKLYNSTKIDHAHHGSVLVIGKFDGIHLGHRILIEHARALSRTHNLPLGVLTFSPHPSKFFRRDLKNYLITPDRLRRDIFQSLGFDFMVEQPFDKSLASLRAHQFIERILNQDLEASHIVVGEDFGFANNREGGIVDLRACKKFSTHPVPIQSDDVHKDYISTTKIRSLLEEGKISLANEQLGRAFTIVGEVLPRHRLGHELGFPTANILAMPDQVLPKFGVYAGRAQLADGRIFDAALNWGVRPTTKKTTAMFKALLADGRVYDTTPDWGTPSAIKNNPAMYEAHLFNFNEDIYGQEIRLALIDYLRPEQKFSTLGALKAQIAKDCEAAKKSLANLPLEHPSAIPVTTDVPASLIPQYELTQIEAATFRRVVQHFRDHPEVQNIDLMLLADFCRNCLSNWYQEEAATRGYQLSKAHARERVYGQPYEEWKARHQSEADPELLRKLEERRDKKHPKP